MTAETPSYRERLVVEGRDFEAAYEYSLDTKGRFVFPAAFRDRFADGLWVMPGMDNCLDIWTREGFTEEKLKVARLPVGSREAREVRRVLMDVRQLSMDGQYRITLPQGWRDEYGLEREIMVAGNIDHVEVWDRNVYRNYLGQARAHRNDLDTELLQ